MIKKNRGLKFTLLFFRFYQMSMLGIPVILSEVSKEFPSCSLSLIQLIATLPDIFIMIFSLCAGLLFVKVTKKKIMLASCLIFILSGCIGALFPASYLNLVLCSVLLGSAIGLLIPSVIGVINDCFKGQEKTKMIGNQNMAVSVGAIICTLFFGIVSSRYSWNLCYLFYAAALFVLVLILLFVPSEQKKDKQKKNININRKLVTFYSVLTLLFFSVYNAIPVNFSIYMNQLGITDTVLISIGSCLLLVGSTFSGWIFYHVYQRLYKTTILLGLLCLMLGLLVLAFSNNVILIFSGLVIAGMSLSFVMAASTNQILAKERSEAAELSVAVMMAASDGGGFLSNLYPLITGVFFPTFSIKQVYIVCFFLLLLLIPVVLIGNSNE